MIHTLLYQILAFTIRGKNIKTLQKIKNLKYSAELPDGYSVSDTQDYFEYILKKHETVTLIILQ